MILRWGGQCAWQDRRTSGDLLTWWVPSAPCCNSCLETKQWRLRVILLTPSLGFISPPLRARLSHVVLPAATRSITRSTCLHSPPAPAGLAGNRNGNSRYCTMLAAAGYVVAAVEHADGSAGAVQLSGGHGWKYYAGRARL